MNLTKEAVFRLAVDRYADTVYRAALHAAPRREDAEDVMQDTFERLLRSNVSFESEEHLKAWLLRVAINRCHDLCRAACRTDVELDEGLAAQPSAEDGRVLAAVRALPEAQRTAVYLHYYEGYTAAEIGRMTDTPLNTVLSRLSRARSRLKELLNEEVEDGVV